MGEDTYLESLVQARDASAVIKAELAIFISGCRDEVKIFAFEGKDDRKVYYHWLKLIDAEIRYEPFLCQTKPRAVKLFDSLVRDAGNLANRVHFFLDRDFDELQGRQITARVYLTDRYSIENYLVSSEVVHDLLLIDLQCGGDERSRRKVMQLFDSIYPQFLASTRDLNFRIFLARRLGIEQVGELPNRIDLITEVGIDSIRAKDFLATELVQLKREPSEEEIAAHQAEFDQLNPSERYRGKFSWLFFMKWLGLVAADRQANAPKLFAEAAAPEGGLPRGFGIDVIASKSRPPESLRAFLAAVNAKRIAVVGG